MPSSIVIVDDTRANLFVLAEILTQAGYRVRPATNGPMALNSIRVELPELILLDIKMPGMSGYEVCEKLKADAYTCDVPVIFISALDDVADKLKGFAAGGVDYITKPFQAEEVLARVKTHIMLRQLQQALQENNRQLLSEIERRKQYEADLRLAASVFDNTIEGIMITRPDGVIEQINPGFVAMTGYQPDELIGQTTRLMRSGLHDREFFRQMWAALLETGQWQGEIWNRRKSGEAYPEWLSISAIKDERGQVQHYVAVYRDISDEKRSAEQLKHQAYHDPLTGLPNRLLFQDRLERALAYAQRNLQHIAVLFLDLDRFKQINDTLGHAVGDFLLKEVAFRLRQCIRNADTVARLGGDEFVLILQDTPDGSHDAAEAARRILAAIQAPFRWDGKTIQTTTSIGIAVFPEDGTDAETLVKHADAAMYRAKTSGRGTYQVFSDIQQPLAAQVLET